MSETIQIFESVLLNLLDSFVPQVDAIFTKFDNDMNNKNATAEENDIFLQKTVLSFPKLVPSYQTTLDVLAEFTTSNPDPKDPQLCARTKEKVNSILISLCNQYKSEANRFVDNDFTLIHIPSPAFRFSCFYHFQFLRSLTLIILTDIIEKIYKRLPNAEAIPKIVQCAFHNCIAPHRMNLVQERLIETWSNIIYIVSKTSLSDISQSFEQFIDEANSSLVINLVNKVNANDDFVELILLSFQQMKKHKTLSSSALSSVSKLLSHAKCGKELLGEFFKLAWSVKTTDTVKDGAIDLITTLYTRLPEEAKKEASFYSSRVMKHIGNSAKLQRTANAFLRLIRGDVSAIENASKGDRLAFIECAGNPYDQTSFPQLFMKSFFTKANFSVCPDEFIDIIIQIAAINMKSFLAHVTPQFLKIDHKDARYHIFLEAVTFINDKKFVEKASCKPTQNMIEELNGLVRESILNNIPDFEKLAGQQKLVAKYSDNVTSFIEECDQMVNEFVTGKNRGKYEPVDADFHSNNIYDNSITFLSAMTSVMPYVLNTDDFNDEHLARGILLLSCAENLYFADLANIVIETVFSDPEGQDVIIGACIVNASQQYQDSFAIHCFAKIYTLLNGKECYLPDDTINELEALSLMAMGWDSSIVRYHAYKLLKVISTLKDQSVFEMIEINNEAICEAAKLSMVVIDTPKKPTITIPSNGFISWEFVCCSRYNTLWVLFYDKCINTIIEYQNYIILDLMREMLYPQVFYIEKGKFTSKYNAGNILFAFFNAFSAEPDQEQVLLNGQYVDYYYNLIIHSKRKEAAKILVSVTKCINWRILNLLHQLVNSFPQELIEETASTMAYVIQIPNSFQNILTVAFRPFIDFISVMQTYFTTIGINNTRTIIWDDEKIKLLKKYETIAVNYCIIIAAVFNNISDQIPEDDWPLSTRQVLVQYLYHWCQLPASEEKIRAYAINALIPILKSGAIFTDGFQFELPMLEIMLERQKEGYDVLSSVLIYHFDIMFDIFVRQIFIRSKHESALFFDAVISSLSVCNEEMLMQDHIGSLLLLTQFWGKEDPTPTKPILTSIAELFITKDKNSSVKSIIGKATNLDFIPVMFSFATEQVIEAGLEIIKSTKLVSTVKNIVAILVPWFAPIRVLPINQNIMQGIPSKFRRFNIISFLTAMSEVSKSVNGEQSEVFSQLWYELLRFKDNSVVVLLCLFELDDPSIKERVFCQLLEKEPALVTKYLSKRCSFAFWYFLVTEKKADDKCFEWILKVLTQAYTNYISTSDLEDLHFTNVLHFCLIFIEKSFHSFEKLISVFGPEFADSVLQFAPDMENGSINISQVVSKLAEGLHEIVPTALEKWAAEAFKWGVCCKDIKVATRSLMVFNALRGEFKPSYVPLVCDAISYHMQDSFVDDCKQLSDFVGECFELFYNNIDLPEVTSIAFDLASGFLDYNDASSKFLRRALPIFKYSSQNPKISSEAKEILIKAFAPSLETDVEAQNLLRDIIEITNSPEALLVAAPFIKHNLSFVDINRTYEEIMATPFDSLHATNVLQMFNDMIKTASQPLIDAIIDVSTVFVRKFKDCLSPRVINPIYCTALTKISMFRSAVDFIMVVSVACPAAAVYNSQTEQEFESKSFEPIRQKIRSMVSDNIDPVPITNCKTIAQLRGIVSQKNPPKITPFSSQHEMFVGLQRTEGPSSRTSSPRRLTTQYSTARLTAVNNRSTVLTSMVSKTNELTTDVKKLPNPEVKGNLFNKSDEEDDNKDKKIRDQFLLSLDEFAMLDE